MVKTSDTSLRIWPKLAGSLLLICSIICPPVALSAPQQVLPGSDNQTVEFLVSVRSGKDMAAEQGATNSFIQHQDDASRQVRVYKTPSRAKTQQVRVLEGHSATISHNESTPYPATFSNDTSGRGYPYLGLEYRDLEHGFTVRPYFNGDQLLLDIGARRDHWSDQDGSTIDSTVIETTIQAELGQWIRLGGEDEPREKTPGTYRSSYSTTNDEEAEIWVRVERLD